MYELVQTGPQSFYIDCPAKIGIYLQSENDIYLIDSGNSKDTAKKVLKIANEKGWTIKGILNTHSHADHIGGNAFIQSKVGCPVFSTGIEADMTQHPVLQPSFLYGGYPCKALRNKFLLAQESVVTDFNSPLFPQEVEIIPVPGHTFNMVGFRTPDDTVFLGDCVSSGETLAKYGVNFIYDVEKYLETLGTIETMSARVFVPSHTAPCHDMTELARINREKVFEIENVIKQLCSTPLTIDEIITGVFEHFGLTMTIEQYVLVGSTLRSYLSWMCDRGVLNYIAENARLLWHTTNL